MTKPKCVVRNVVFLLCIVSCLLLRAQMSNASSWFQTDLKVSDLIELNEEKAKNFTVTLDNPDPPMEFSSTASSLPVLAGPTVLFKSKNSDLKLELRFIGGTKLTIDQLVAPAIDLCNFMHQDFTKPGSSNRVIFSIGPRFQHIDKIGNLQVKGEMLKYIFGPAEGKQANSFFGVIKPNGCNEVVVVTGEEKLGAPFDLKTTSAMLSAIVKFKPRHPQYPHFGAPVKTESLEEKANHFVKMQHLPADYKVTEVYLLPPSYMVQHTPSGQKILVLMSTKFSPDPSGALDHLASLTKESIQPKRADGNISIDLGPIQNGAPFKSIKKKGELDLPIGKMAYFIGTAGDGSERFVGFVDTTGGSGLDIVGMQQTETVYDLDATKQFLEQLMGHSGRG
jgi:hypothetical protein